MLSLRSAGVLVTEDEALSRTRVPEKTGAVPSLQDTRGEHLPSLCNAAGQNKSFKTKAALKP